MEEDRSQLIKVAKIEAFMEALKERFDKVEGKLDKFIESADRRYASKRTEKNVDRLAWLVVTAVVLGVLAFYLKV